MASLPVMSHLSPCLISWLLVFPSFLDTATSAIGPEILMAVILLSCPAIASLACISLGIDFRDEAQVTVGPASLACASSVRWEQTPAQFLLARSLK